MTIYTPECFQAALRTPPLLENMHQLTDYDVNELASVPDGFLRRPLPFELGTQSLREWPESELFLIVMHGLPGTVLKQVIEAKQAIHPKFGPVMLAMGRAYIAELFTVESPETKGNNDRN